MPGKGGKLIVWILAIVGAVALIALVVVQMPWIISIFWSGNVVIPVSHFVGDHGKNKKLVVFVHGVNGDMDATWLNTYTGESWPKLMKSDPDFSQFDVFVYGYYTPLLMHASGIKDIADRLSQQLKDKKIFSSYDEVDFITHSMGGIITKRMLNTLRPEPDTLQRIHCVIYLAVPSNGADLAGVASWISLNPQFKSMSPDDVGSFLQTTEDDWAALLKTRRPDPAPENWTI